MPREDAIRLVAQVVEVVGERLFRVKLSNGHLMLAYGPGRQRQELGLVRVGDRLDLEISPFDFSKGRIVSVEQQ